MLTVRNSGNLQNGKSFVDSTSMVECHNDNKLVELVKCLFFLQFFLSFIFYNIFVIEICTKHDILRVVVYLSIKKPEQFRSFVVSDFFSL